MTLQGFLISLSVYLYSMLVTDPLYNNGTGSVYRCMYQEDQCVQLPIEGKKLQITHSVSHTKYSALSIAHFVWRLDHIGCGSHGRKISLNSAPPFTSLMPAIWWCRHVGLFKRTFVTTSHR